MLFERPTYHRLQVLFELSYRGIQIKQDVILLFVEDDFKGAGFDLVDWTGLRVIGRRRFHFSRTT